MEPTMKITPDQSSVARRPSRSDRMPPTIAPNMVPAGTTLTTISCRRVDNPNVLRTNSSAAAIIPTSNP